MTTTQNVETLTLHPATAAHVVPELRSLGYRPIVTRLDTGHDHVAYDLNVRDNEGDSE